MRRALAILLISILASFATLEVSLRTLGAFLPGTYRIGSLIEPDELLGWRHVRSETYVSRSLEWNVRVDLNAQGRRGPEIGAKRDAGRRIAILGDSYVEAVQVDDGDTFGRRLVDALGSSATEVVDDGVSGYGPDQEVLAFEGSAPGLGLDAAVLALALANDVWNDYEPFEQTRPTTVKPFFTLAPDGTLSVRAAPAIPLWDRLRREYARSAALSMLKSAFAPDRPPADLRRRQLAVLEPASGEWDAAWKITEAILARFAGDARRMGVRPLLVIVPEGCQVHVDLCEGAPELGDLRIAQDRLMRFAQGIGLPAVDLLPEFRAEAARGSRLYFRRDLHWTAAGHALAAKIVAEALRPLIGGAPRASGGGDGIAQRVGHVADALVGEAAVERERETSAADVLGHR